MINILSIIALSLGIFVSLCAIVALIMTAGRISKADKADKPPEHYYKVGGTENDDE